MLPFPTTAELEHVWPEDLAVIHDVVESVMSVNPSQTKLVVAANPYRSGVIFGVQNAATAATLSTSPTPAANQGIQFSTAIANVYLVGPGYSMLAGLAWYCHNPAASAIAVTVIETILNRPRPRPRAGALVTAHNLGRSNQSLLRDYLTRAAGWQSEVLRSMGSAKYEQPNGSWQQRIHSAGRYGLPMSR